MAPNCALSSRHSQARMMNRARMCTTLQGNQASLRRQYFLYTAEGAACCMQAPLKRAWKPCRPYFGTCTGVVLKTSRRNAPQQQPPQQQQSIIDEFLY